MLARALDAATRVMAIDGSVGIRVKLRLARLHPHAGLPGVHRPAGVALVTSDAHAGLVEAIGATLPGAAWQRCRVH